MQATRFHALSATLRQLQDDLVTLEHEDLALRRILLGAVTEYAPIQQRRAELLVAFSERLDLFEHELALVRQECDADLCGLRDVVGGVQ